MLICALFIYSIKGLTFNVIALSLMAGCMEEVVFRALPLSLMMRTDRSPKNIWLAIILTSLIFGAIHITNLSSGADPTSTAIQVISTLGTGFFFAAIFLRTGNIGLTIFFHFLHNVLCEVQDIYDGAVIVTKAAPADIAMGIAIAIVMVIAGIKLVKGKEDKIAQVWAERWGDK